MPNLGPTELILILVIVIALFGAGKLANLGGALGKGVRDFKTAVKEGQDDEGGALPSARGSSVRAKTVSAANTEVAAVAAPQNEKSSEAV